MEVVDHRAGRDFAAAVERLRWYAAQQGIEVFHRVLKSGCQIEERGERGQCGPLGSLSGHRFGGRVADFFI